MGTRYAALSAQQAKLTALFRGAGYSGELPSFLTSTGSGADHPLLAWMASELNLDANFLPEVEANAARLAMAEAEQRRLDKVEEIEDSLLVQFEEVVSVVDDVATCGTDQNQAHGTSNSAVPAAWLEEETLESSDAQLMELAEERAMLKEQIQELIAVEAQLDAAHKAARSASAGDQAEAEALRAQAVACRSELEQLSTALDSMLSELHEVLSDVGGLARMHSDRWLLCAKSAERDAYLVASEKFMDALLNAHLHQQHSGRAATVPSCSSSVVATRADGTCAPVLARTTQIPGVGALHPCNDPAWVTRNDPFATQSADREHLTHGLDAPEVESMLAELARLGEAQKQAEEGRLLAAMDAAQHAAELTALRALLAGDSVLDDAQAAPLEEEFAHLQVDERRAMEGSVPAILDAMVRRQEAKVLQAHYQLQQHALGGQIQQRKALVRMLLRHSARHLLVHSLSQAERLELQALHSAAQTVEATLESIESAASSRCLHYSASAVLTTDAPSGGEAGLDALTAASSDGQADCSAPTAGGALARLAALLCAAQTPVGSDGGCLAAGGTDQGCSSVRGMAVSGGALAATQAASAACQLSALQHRWRAVLAGVSATLCVSLPELLLRGRRAAQDAHALLFGPPGDVAGSPPKIRLHPKELGERLHALRMSACEMNELINSAVADNARLHAVTSEARGEVDAERAVLEWFHGAPHKLAEHVATVEQQIAALSVC